MKFIKKSSRENPKISLILLDWSVRESFHLLYYLAKQSLPKNQFEVIVIEYYSYISDAIKKYENQVDTWILLEMPKNCYYHKHLMYNVGIAVAKGEIIIICDSDAMAKPSFLKSVLLAFENDADIVLHVDQFRNNRRDLYPFCFPSFEKVIGTGCINNVDGKTKGIMSADDPLHERNYGACLCAKRADLIRIGGADEHIDFIGHICGPYDLTFRLINLGKKEIWHQDEFLYHTWHPGQAGVDNYLGPHDGRHMSTTALEALYFLRILPHVINPAIVFLMDHDRKLSELDLERILISSENLIISKPEFLESVKSRAWAGKTYSCFVYWGYRIVKKTGLYQAAPILNSLSSKPHTLEATEIRLLKHKIRREILHRNFYFKKNFFIFIKIFFLNFYKKIFFSSKFLSQNKKFRMKEKLARAVRLRMKIYSKFPILSEHVSMGLILFLYRPIRFILFLRKMPYFIARVFRKLINISIEKKINVNYLVSLLSNLSFIDKPKNERIFLFIDNSLLGFFIIYLYIVFLRKNFITLKKTEDKDSLHEYLKQLSTHENASFVIVSRACFLQYPSSFVQVRLKEAKLYTLVV
jgi:hypothetical protein